MFWESLSSADREAVLAVGTRTSYAEGARLFLEGDPPTHVLVLRSGRVKLTSSSAEGQEVLIEIRGPGYLLGELGPIDDVPRISSAIALDPVEAIVMSAPQFRQLLTDRGTLAYQVIVLVSDKLRQATSRRLEVGTSDAQARLCQRLVELAVDGDLQPDGTVEIQSSLTQQEMAEWIGVSRDAVVLSLRHLRESGYLETGRRKIRILDLEAIGRMASY